MKKVLTFATFNSTAALTRFVNRNEIKQCDIQQISFADGIVIFYWIEESEDDNKILDNHWRSRQLDSSHP